MKFIKKKYFLTFWILLIILINFERIKGQDCMPGEGCQYYICEEKNRNCGTKGYLINYGYKYCNFFTSKYYSRFSKSGQEWVRKTAYCLQSQINAFPDSLSCRTIKKKAMKGHLECHLEAGYCNLSRKDRRLVFRIVARNPRNWIIGLSYLKKIRKYCKGEKKNSGLL